MGQYILKTIQMTLDEKSINNAIREVKRFQETLKPAMQSLIDYLREKGVEIARAELIFFDDPAYMTGALSESITSRNENGVGIVSAGEGLVDGQGKGSYAIYVEYGTGIYGGYANETNPEGWWYPSPWGPVNGRKHYIWTNGMKPRRFMQHTLDDLADEAEASGGRVIAEYIRGERA
jgi:hypothetical protein